MRVGGGGGSGGEGGVTNLGVRPRATQQVLEGLHALLAAAVLHSLTGISKRQRTVLKGEGDHSPAPHRLGQRGPGQVDHPSHPLAGGHSDWTLQG